MNSTKKGKGMFAIALEGLYKLDEENLKNFIGIKLGNYKTENYDLKSLNREEKLCLQLYIEGGIYTTSLDRFADAYNRSPQEFKNKMKNAANKLFEDSKKINKKIRDRQIKDYIKNIEELYEIINEVV